MTPAKLLKTLAITLLVGASLAFTMTAATPEARAQACCTATAAGDFAVVGRCHASVVASQLTFESTRGGYDRHGTYQSLSDATIADAILTLGAGSRLGTQRFQVYGSLPLRLQYRDLSGIDSDTGFDLGDASTGVRFTLVEDPMIGIRSDDRSTWKPFLDLYLNANLPTGESPDSAAIDSANADVTGNGLWQGVAGTRLSKFVTPRHVVTASAEYTRSLARDVDRRTDTVSFRPGDEQSLSVAYMHMPNFRWSWGLNAGVVRGGDARQDGTAVDNTSLRRTTVGAHITRMISYPFWEVTLSLSSDALLDDLSKNVPFTGPALSLGLQRNFL